LKIAAGVLATLFGAALTLISIPLSIAGIGIGGVLLGTTIITSGVGLIGDGVRDIQTPSTTQFKKRLQEAESKIDEKNNPTKDEMTLLRNE